VGTRVSAARAGARFNVQGSKVQGQTDDTLSPPIPNFEPGTWNFELKTTEGRFYVCDFAAEGKVAEELMLGRTLTVSRARELNAKDYFYQMLKDNPEMLKIYPGIENELLDGAIDCHIHA
jgi:hypothetical protein